MTPSFTRVPVNVVGGGPFNNDILGACKCVKLASSQPSGRGSLPAFGESPVPSPEGAGSFWFWTSNLFVSLQGKIVARSWHSRAAFCVILAS